MSREIVGSKFEQDPDDGRTWDEKVQPVGDDDGDDVEYEDDDGEWPDDGAEHDAWAALTEARREVAELEPIVASRPPASGLTFDPQAERLAEVSQRLDMLTAHLLGESYDWDDSPDDWWWHETFAVGLPPDGWTPVVSGAPSQGKPPRLDDILREQLTEPEWQHFEWLVAGRPQAEIAAALGISQPAVTKRERKLRSRANDIAMEATGREYPFLPRTQAKGGHPRLS